MQMPIATVNAFAAMLPRLQAEENLMGQAVVQMGTGNFGEERDAKKLMAQWTSTASGRRAGDVAPLSRQEIIDRASMAGFNVVREGVG